MSVHKTKTRLFDLVYCIARATDLVSPQLGWHHLQVAYAAGMIGRTLGMDGPGRTKLMLAGMVHDVGGLSTDERVRLAEFEAKEVERHCEVGYRLLARFEPLSEPAAYIKFHHSYWNDGEGVETSRGKVPFESFVLHLADRAVVSLRRDVPALEQAERIRKRIQERTGTMFHPEVAEAFEEAASRDAFWLDLVSNELGEILSREVRDTTVDLEASLLLDFTKVLSALIDFRSRFTAAHSAGVAATARELALLCGFSQEEARRMTVAGYLHDLGKLAVPVELLDKPDKLTREEFAVVRSHTYHSFRLLEQVPGLEDVNEWASLHHERPDGKGYPFGLDRSELSLGARIMAVADVFTATIEARPYRPAMSVGQAIILLDAMAAEQGLDSDVVDKLKADKDRIYDACRLAQKTARQAYDTLRREVSTIPGGTHGPQPSLPLAGAGTSSGR